MGANVLNTLLYTLHNYDNNNNIQLCKVSIFYLELSHLKKVINL